MNDCLYMSWRYLASHKVKTLILVVSVMLIVYLPVGLRVVVKQSAAELTQRASATPLLVGARGSPLELVLNALYFESAPPAPTPYGEVERVASFGWARAIPLATRFQAQDQPIVGTTLEYFDFRGLTVAEGRMMTRLGECVLGRRAAERLDVQPGDTVRSSPETVFDLAGVYPLKMRVAGILAASGGPDDWAVFVDVRTAWVIEGLAHGHQDVAAPDAAGLVLKRDETQVVANASVVQYNEITEANIGAFHFHGLTEDFPVTAVIVIPHDAKSGTLLRGRYLNDDEPTQIVSPLQVMEALLGTVLTVQQYVIAAVVIVGLSTVATATLVFLLSLRLRSREIETMHKIGASRARVASMLGLEIALVVVVALILAGALTALTSLYGEAAIRALVN